MIFVCSRKSVDPNGPASSGQIWAMRTLSGRKFKQQSEFECWAGNVLGTRFRENELTRAEASRLIDAMNRLPDPGQLELFQ